MPVIRSAGADVVVVSAHSGDSGTSSYAGDLPVENAAALLAEQVPGIDAILFGHAHREVSQRFVTNAETGRQVVMSEPKNWGQRLSVFDLTLELVRGKWTVAASSATTLNTNTVVDDPALVAVVQAQHDAVVEYVNQTVATSTEAMSAAEACWKDTAILDYVNVVQEATVAAAVAGTPEASLPIVSIAAPFNRAASFPAGPVSIKDVAGLYIYDNTLLASILTGAQIKDYLEYSAEYFKPVAADAPVDPASWTNANNRPDYNYDQFSGVEYDVDVSQPVGSRIVGLSYAGRSGGGRPAVPRRGEQLPAVGRWRIPAHRHGAGRLQRAGRHSRGDRLVRLGGGHDRSGDVPRRELAARAQRRAGVLTRRHHDGGPPRSGAGRPREAHGRTSAQSEPQVLRSSPSPSR